MSSVFHKVTQPKVALSIIAVFVVYAVIRIATLDAILVDGRPTAKCVLTLVSLFAEFGYLCAIYVIARAIRDDRYFESVFVVLFVIPAIGGSHGAAIDGVMKFQRPEFSEFSLMDLPVMHGFALGLYVLCAAIAFMLAYSLLAKRYGALK